MQRKTSPCFLLRGVSVCKKVVNDNKTFDSIAAFAQIAVYASDGRLLAAAITFITFRVSRRRRKMYCGHPRLSVCLSAAARPHYCTDPDVTWGSGRACPLVVHYWADLQTAYALRCYGNITRTQNVSEYVLVLAVCLV